MDDKLDDSPQESSNHTRHSNYQKGDDISGSSHNGSPQFQSIAPRNIAHLHRLASLDSLHRPISRVSTDNPDPRAQDPALDPSSPRFHVYRWAKWMITSMAEDHIPTQRSGFCFQDLNVYGSGPSLNIQKDVLSIFMAPVRIHEWINFGDQDRRCILHNFNGVVKAGEMLVVLGRPGSGCSTFLKSIAGELHGLELGSEDSLSYDGKSIHDMMTRFKGDVCYNQEVEKHFPHLTVAQTLRFAAAVRTPRTRYKNLPRKYMANYMADVVMAALDLTHTRDTKVGNEFVRGISGGERKRVSIAEMALSRAPIAAWDNSSRGLDSSTALKFVRALKTASDLSQMTQLVAIYQASQAIYDIFDKATVLYEGRQIYFGRASEAKQYFIDMGWECPARQTTGDFLTSVTNPDERLARPGYDARVPRTPEEFERYWLESEAFQTCQKEIEAYKKAFPSEGPAVKEFQNTHRAEQVRHTLPRSPYLISTSMQIKECTIRAYQRMAGDMTSTVVHSFVQIIMAPIIASMFFNSSNTTAGLLPKGSVIFFSVMLNTLISVLDINRLYDLRPIVEKQASYAFYHPFAEGLASTLADIPIRFVSAAIFNIILYFMTGLRREPSQFFIFLLFNYVAMLTMTFIFRTIGAATKRISQALAIAGVMLLGLIIYTGFVIPKHYMHPWFKWIMYINPIAYAFEALMTNEVHGRNYTCGATIPAYQNLTGATFVCSVAGALPGQTYVSGDSWVEASYQYSYSHIWRNLGILIAFGIFFMFTYLFATEFNTSASSTADLLVFRSGHAPRGSKRRQRSNASDTESNRRASIASRLADDKEMEEFAIAPQKEVFTWRNVCYDITVKGGKQRRLLDRVSGFVSPGTLTVLMGPSGAGKTTLLDVLAQRTRIGVVTGDMFVSGRPLEPSFQRETGYVQQLDLHLETTTVREALRFSAMMRQPKTVSKKEKYAYVEEVIKLLRMQTFGEAVVGIPGEGLNVEQRKLLTIGVELAAKPDLLLFLDEPTSGLDSQSSWSIVAFLRRLADHGQAVLCTVHQPSAILFQQFERLLLLGNHGQPCYFGQIGPNSRILIDYFERNGSRPCGPAENPAEYMLEVIGNENEALEAQNWAETWMKSPENSRLNEEIDRIHQKSLDATPGEKLKEAEHSHKDESEFAMPFTSQLWEVSLRVFQQYWRTPDYIWNKLGLGTFSALFLGFSFYQADASLQGLQDVLYALFMLTATFTITVQQIMPRFVTQRSLYEVRERPSKAYSWKAFLIANIFVEIPYSILLGVLVFASIYYPVFGITSSERQGIVLLYCIELYIYACTFAHMLISWAPDPETAGPVAIILFAMSLLFNGVMQPPSSLPGFWMFMYRVSPLTYWVGGIAATTLHGRPIQCAAHEVAKFLPPSGQNCGEYMAPYMKLAPGRLLNPTSSGVCEYCPMAVADQFLANSDLEWGQRWRDFGLLWVYILFNVFMAVVLYYVFRVRRWSKDDVSEASKGRVEGLKKRFRRT
ncbi:ATP-binding cassette transporter [Mytilinidion resinicola]|uniref:ATP-binding cassette transporter n=1 Tax=Mytilinidion resinicola TaxID=574789 RepID=A0A6A6Z0G3_9PEZI|nr:ATP-binding cassette transporter [Mytilinidion resinicola]KAF2814193.1 ATP-binding cassette transporter [Mytilinidion resinicola]